MSYSQSTTTTKFTPDAQLDLLFPTELIPESVKEALPKELHVRDCPGLICLDSRFLQLRPLASTDYQRGHLNILAVLTQAPDVGAQRWSQQFKLMKATPGTYYCIVIVDKASDNVVAVGGVFMERKFLRGLGLVGHIEDIAVDKSQQGKKLGLRIINALTGISERLGAYKTILNCSTENIRELSLSRFGGPYSCHDQPSMRSVASRPRRTRW
jgi:glucosamine-phosphate N-acetyltransferase